MCLIGICGRSGSGKSTVSGHYRDLGYIVIDADLVGRSVMKPGDPCVRELAAAFGNDILNSDGTVNRKALAAHAIPDALLRNRLNTITHKYILAEFDRLTAQAESIVFVDAPLLFESGYNKKCKYIIGVISEDRLCIQRITARDSLDSETASVRISSQNDNRFIRENCDYIIENNTTVGQLIEKSDIILEIIRKQERFI